MPYLLFLKKQQNLKLASAAIIGGALRFKYSYFVCFIYFRSILEASRVHRLRSWRQPGGKRLVIPKLYMEEQHPLMLESNGYRQCN